MRIVKFFLFLILIALSLNLRIGLTQATGIFYCGELANYKCVKPYTNVADLWKNTSWEFYPPLGFNTKAEYYNFHTVHFEFYIPYYVVERGFAAEDTDGYFTMSEWSNYDKNKNFVSDDIDEVVQEFENTYKWYVDDYKIKMPWKGGSNGRMEVLFADIMQPDGGTVFGKYQFKESGGPFMQIDLAISPSFDDLKGTIAHEMFHAIQNGKIEAKYLMYNNFAEGMAVMLESKLYNGGEFHLAVDDVSPKQNPRKSIFGMSDAENATSYGSYLWYAFLHQKYGKSIVNELLESYAGFADSNIDDSMEYLTFLTVDKALKNHGTDVASAYTEFALWNYDKGKYTDGKKMRPVTITKVHNDYVKKYTMNLNAPYAFGSNYIEINVTGNLQVSFTGNADAEFHLWFLPIRKGSSVDYKNVVQKKVKFGATKKVILPFEGDYKKFAMIVSVVDAKVDEAENGDAFNQKIYPYSYSVQSAPKSKNKVDKKK